MHGFYVILLSALIASSWEFSSFIWSCIFLWVTGFSVSPLAVILVRYSTCWAQNIVMLSLHILLQHGKDFRILLVNIESCNWQHYILHASYRVLSNREYDDLIFCLPTSMHWKYFWLITGILHGLMLYEQYGINRNGFDQSNYCS